MAGKSVPLYAYSLEIELLTFLQRKFNFQANFIDNREDWGNWVNGSWTGSVGLVHNGTAHFGMCKVSQTLQRFEDFDFSQPIFTDDLTFMVQSAGTEKSIQQVLRSFDRSVWACAVLSLVSLVVLLKLVSPSISVLKMIFIFLGIAFRQGMLTLIIHLTYDISFHPAIAIPLMRRNHRPLIRLLLGLWLFVCFVLYSMFSSNLFASIVVLKFKPSLDTLDDLREAASSDSHSIVLAQGNSFLSRFTQADADNQLYHIIGEHINR